VYRANAVAGDAPVPATGQRGKGEGNRSGGNSLGRTTAALIHAPVVGRCGIRTALPSDSRRAVDAVGVSAHRGMTMTDGRHVSPGTG
jgi:hypothetical protein